MRKLLLLMLGVFLATAQLLAQNRTVTGKVIDDNGNPVENASVVPRGNNQQGVITGADGSFSINVAPGVTTLVISSVNFQTVNATIGSGPISVRLTQRNSSMDEVVVVGYQQRRKRDEAGAISTVNARTIENRPNVSLDKALQ